MGVLILVCVVILFTIVPVMVAAKMLNASNTGFWSCLVAVVLSSIVGNFVTQFIQAEGIAALVSFVISAVIFSVVLGAKYVQSACIALLAVVIQYGSIFLLGLLGLTLVSGINA